MTGLGRRAGGGCAVTGEPGLVRLGLLGILATARVEFSLSIRSVGFWAVQVALLAPALLVLVPDGLSGNFLRFSSQQLREVVAFTLLLLPLLVLPSLKRTHGARGDLVFATQHDSSGHALGTLLGVVAWLVPSAFAQLGARWLLGELVGGQARWALLSAGPVLLLASLTLGLGVLACLNLVWRRTLPVLLVWLGLWILVLQRAGGLLGGFVGPYMPLFDSWNVFFEGLMFSPAAGLGWSRPLAFSLAAWLALLGASLLAGWLLLAPRTDARRSNRWRLVPGVSLLLFGGLAVMAFVGMQREVTLQQPAGTPRAVVLDAWRVIDSELEVAFDPDAAPPISGSAALTLMPVTKGWSGELLLRLRPGMRLEASSGGRPLPVVREGDSVLVDLTSLELGDAQEVLVELSFEGEPVWPYADHRFGTGGAFPTLDSSQPITSAAVGGVGYLLRDGDWRPWPWSTGPQLAEREDSVVVHLPEQKATIYREEVPQLLEVVAPEGGWQQEGVGAQAGKDPGAGLIQALESVARGADRLWDILGEPTAPQVTALPYLPDAYASFTTVVIPESYDLSHHLQVGAAYQRDVAPELAERAGYQLLARAWLNGHARHPRAYAEATRTRGELQALDGAGGPGGGTNYRMLQVVPSGPLGTPWAEIWHGTDPNQFDVTPFALWLGMELSDPQVRQADLAVFRRLEGSAQDHLDLRKRGLPWNLYRQLPYVRMAVALSDWAEAVGGEEAVRLFAQAYRTVPIQSHDSLLEALAELSGVPVPLESIGGSQ